MKKSSTFSLSLSLSLSRGPSRFFSIEEVEDAKGNSVCLSALGLSLSFFLDTHGHFQLVVVSGGVCGVKFSLSLFL